HGSDVYSGNSLICTIGCTSVNFGMSPKISWPCVAVEALTAACRSGPPAACVERIEVEIAEGEGPPAGFRVTATV
ncbi:MAG: hypothetical protein QOJ27_1953, partial [Sphingomonadales bacterium]|nr:hypothetical protein [Sphingomonadales bacterium]